MMYYLELYGYGARRRAMLIQIYKSIWQAAPFTYRLNLKCSVEEWICSLFCFVFYQEDTFPRPIFHGDTTVTPAVASADTFWHRRDRTSFLVFELPYTEVTSLLNSRLS